MRALALDPGGTTGWRTYAHGTESVGGQITGKKHHLKLYEELRWMDPTVIICESFIYRNKIKVDLMAREYIGVVEFYCQKFQVELVMQPATIGKDKSGFWTDEKLKKIGLYTPGKPHQNDATRHMLHYLTEVLGDKYFLYLLRE